MSGTVSFSEPIPKGLRIYYGRLSIAGIHRRKLQAQAAANGKGLRLVLVPEPGNKHDKNAVQIVAEYKGWFLSHTVMLGYIQRDVAADIAASNMLPALQVRPRELWVGDRGGFDFIIDLLGPKARYKEFFVS